MLKDPLKIKIGDEIRRLREEDPKALADMIAGLSGAEAIDLQYDWQIMGRPDQIIDWENPEYDWASYTLVLAGRGWGKDLADSTPIFTKNRGWVLMGDLEKGDVVFSETGEPCNVTGKYKPNKRKLYELRFSDGCTITSSCEHDWITWEHRDRKAYVRSKSTVDGSSYPSDWPFWKSFDRSGKETGVGPRKRTTQDIIDTLTHGKRNDTNHSIPLCEPLVIQERELPIDPYRLGYWLGDGNSDGTGISAGEGDAQHVIDSFGYGDETIYKSLHFYNTSMKKSLIDNSLHKNKHIPDEYFNSSVEQRLELLRGLMDSDGYADTSHVEFCNTNKKLAYGVVFLARSLGEKPRVYEGIATLYGKDCGPKYRVKWRPRKFNPFRMKRKADKVLFGGSQSLRNHSRMVVSYREVPWEPTTCIEVDSKSHLFLAGEGLIPTHNSRCGAEFIKDCVVNHGMTTLAMIGPTAKDTRNIMTLGPSGLCSVFPPEGEWEAHYSMGKSVVEMRHKGETKATIGLFSTEASPDSIRGGNYQAIWGDEIVAWAYAEEFFNQAAFTLRLDPSRMLMTTTGKATPLLLNLVKREGKDVRIIRGNTMDNRQNLSKAFISQLEATYAGTRLGKQEMGSDILLENDKSLWKMSTIMQNTVDEDDLPDFDQVVVSIDPATTRGSSKSDDTGIIVAAMGVDGIIYILGDFTKQMSPEEWSSRACTLHEKYSGQCNKVTVVVERNQGGDMVTDVLLRRNRNLEIKTVFATASKYDRGVAPSLLGEQGKVKFVRQAQLEQLQEELVTFDGSQKRSPNRFDSHNQAIHHLSPVNKRFTNVTELLM